MAKCCICGKPAKSPLSSSCPDDFVCPTCAAAKNGIETRSLTMKLNADYLAQFLPKMPEGDAKTYLTELLASAAPPEETASVKKPIETEDQRKIREWRERVQQITASVMVTSGYNFEGYAIEHYFDFISSESVIGLGTVHNVAADFSNLLGTESNTLKTKLTYVKMQAFFDLRNEAFKLGANAIIGADLDFTMFGASTVCVIASGTAVRIRKL